jgi:DNA polymerase V
MVALVDCNNFYCSCERFFNPALNGKPVVVLSNNDGSIIARSEEAKALGIGMAVPMFKVKHIIEANDVTVFSSNYPLYEDMSDRVLKILASFVPRIEVYSIDEAFLDMSVMPFSDLFPLANKIRQTVRQYTGIPVSIGIAATKTLAKAANHYCKTHCPDKGVYVLHSNENKEQVLEQTAIREVWGIGSQYGGELEKCGYATAQSLLNAPLKWIRSRMSVVGERTLNELNGIPSIAWETPQLQKNVSVTRTLPQRSNDRSFIEEAIANYTATCALKLRKNKSHTRRITVFLQTNPFFHRQLQHTPTISIPLDTATNDTGELIAYAMKSLSLIFLPHYMYQRAGVMLQDLVPESAVPVSLFDESNRIRSKKMMSTIDAINSSLGREIVRFSKQGFSKRYLPQAKNRSQRYTTRIDETLQINI